MRHPYDLIVVGFGAAGAAAAIEAADAGARVLILDRAHGGGASTLSGGVVYAGGGTAQQRAAGIDDTPEDMFAYLTQEVGDAVSESTLRRFCEQSVGTLEWLETLGARYEGSLAPYKTSYPSDKHYLYYSGNENAWPYRERARPAPRGHRTVARGMSSGAALFRVLRRAVESRSIQVVRAARVDELIMEDGAVVGARYGALTDPADLAAHARILRRGAKLGNFAPALGAVFDRQAARLWRGRATRAQATGARVLLSGGGFVMNAALMDRHAGPYRNVNPLGTAGDDGGAIMLGVEAGGSTGKMDRLTAWRFLTPPSALLGGVAVGMDGKRIANEDLYGATFSDSLLRNHEGKGRLVLDASQWRAAKSQVRAQSQIFQALQALFLFTLGHRRAATLASLARRTGVSVAGLESTVNAYNSGISGEGDPAHKHADIATPVARGPFYAIDISVGSSPFYPVPGLTLGGLRVNEETGAVLREGGGEVTGLLAAGRSAVGICSNSYLSGLSLADCLFSGRRAGRTVAAALAPAG
ncbi:FAD-binding protein [Leucobacter aridicollis]|uniref:3-oxo-5alpha-steroid 4-dehydrogenase n=1 Tax=Leucobacter aridicollis TaxID=283878 RepID=A0A852RGW1_9MICO|nr:FAD-binding protein [Leucobacter aridicollis]MBL3681523.1 FAD-binding protein [Leucobacter aridicollis]NYD27444.1 3-oxo-5alpha-steroid 4-dehydrogenase [Leucobacter aridicollis]